MIDTKARRRRVWWIAGGLAVVLAAAAGVAVTAWPATPAPVAAAPASPSPVVTVEPVKLKRPAASAPRSQWQAWVGQEAEAAMKRQSAALLAGDFAGFTADALPGAKAELGRRYRSLRSLHVTRFEQSVGGNPWPPAEAGGDWRVETLVDHCLVEKECAADYAYFDSMWRITPQGLRLAGYHVYDEATTCFDCTGGSHTFSRPWETTELVARAGRRTLVAVPLAYRSRLADLSRRAEAAAAVADRYTVGEGRVDRYRVFLADAASWKRWYRGNPGSWVAGWAVPTGRDRIETEVLASEMTPGYSDELLRHELAHVSTLRNDSYYGKNDVWWLVEGMADHVALAGNPQGTAQERQDLHRYLRSHNLTTVAVPHPPDDASNDDAGGRYAVGYYALHYLIAKYGQKAALAFFQQAVQQGIGLEGAAISSLHKPWSQVNRECVAAVRKA
ncbi:hypothetical protein ACGFJ7_19525 [Actinoplanes sp. NPDC048988]|uniref:hypothetical protein n=1 Tax=Actinoplanes sp. NPDC048988 TaxID=3363901 RepID=UPI003716B6A1